MEPQTKTQPIKAVNKQAAARPNYLLVLIVLVAVTAVEVGVSYVTGGIKIPVLLLLAAFKASLVVLYFMHLKFDSRVFAYWFILGLALILPLTYVLWRLTPGP